MHKQGLKVVFKYCAAISLIMLVGMGRVEAQAYQSLLDMCPGCEPNVPQVPEPTCVDCEVNTSTSAPAAQSISSYNTQLQGVYAREGSQENDKGVAAYNSRDWDKAISHFKKALKFTPGNSVIQANLDNAIAQRDWAKNAAARAAAARADYERQLAAYKKQVEEEKKREATFVHYVNQDVLAVKDVVGGLRKSIASYVPPLPGPKRTIEDGVIMGIRNSQNNNAIKNKGLSNPLSGKAIAETDYFAVTDETGWSDLVRGILDNYSMGKYTLDSDVGRKLVQELDGTKFNRLIAHSNGATVTEALIRESVIQVDELHIIGGDRSLQNLEGLNELIASGKVKKIVVWVNPGDIVPVGSSVTLVKPIQDQAMDSYLRLFNNYFDNKLIRPKTPNLVDYRMLRGPEYQGQSIQWGESWFEPHGIEVYFENMRRYRLSHP
jgi:tetratricopeptide (TPR) repeat protein